ncbi:hypothetical protein STEG23_004104, partial [Scotinomys teguina]
VRHVVLSICQHNGALEETDLYVTPCVILSCGTKVSTSPSPHATHVRTSSSVNDQRLAFNNGLTFNYN